MRSSQAGIGMAVAGLQQDLLLNRAQPAIPTLGGSRFAGIAHGIVVQPHPPLFDSDGKQVREQGEFQAYSAGGLVSSQALIAVLGYQLRGMAARL